MVSDIGSIRFRLVIRKPSAARHPATTAARLVPAVLAGSGDDRGGLALSESTRTVDASPSDVAG